MNNGLDLPVGAAMAVWALEVEHWRMKVNERLLREWRALPLSPVLMKLPKVSEADCSPLVERVVGISWHRGLDRWSNFSACVVLLNGIGPDPVPVVGMAKRIATKKRRVALRADGTVKSWHEPVDPWDANAARGITTYRAVEAAARLLGVRPAGGARACDAQRGRCGRDAEAT